MPNDHVGIVRSTLSELIANMGGVVARSITSGKTARKSASEAIAQAKVLGDALYARNCAAITQHIRKGEAQPLAALLGDIAQPLAFENALDDHRGFPLPSIVFSDSIAELLATLPAYRAQVIAAYYRGHAAPKFAASALDTRKNITAFVQLARPNVRGWWRRMAPVLQYLDESATVSTPPMALGSAIAEAILRHPSQFWTLELLEWCLPRCSKHGAAQLEFAVPNFCDQLKINPRHGCGRMLTKILELHDHPRVKQGVLIVLDRIPVFASRVFRKQVDFFAAHGWKVQDMTFELNDSAWTNRYLISIVVKRPAIRAAWDPARNADLLLAILGCKNHRRDHWAKLATQLLSDGVRLDTPRIKQLYRFNADHGKAYEDIVQKLSIKPQLRSKPRP